MRIIGAARHYGCSLRENFSDLLTLPVYEQQGGAPLKPVTVLQGITDMSVTFMKEHEAVHSVEDSSHHHSDFSSSTEEQTLTEGCHLPYTSLNTWEHQNP